MAIPVSETGRELLIAILESVTTLASDTTTKALSVESVNRYGNDANDLDTVVELGGDEWLDEGDPFAAVGHDTYHIEYLVFVNIQEPEGSPAFDLRANTVAADVRKAVMTQASPGGSLLPTFQWIKPRGMSVSGLKFFTNEAGQTAGVVIPFTGCLRTKLNDPYSQ